MDTRHIEEFLVFSESTNYTVAAKKLFITRPTLVEHIHELELELGCPLVENVQGKVALTIAGKRFTTTGSELLTYLQDIVNEYQNLEHNLIVVTIAQTNLPWLETILYKARQVISAKSPHKKLEIITTNGACSNTAPLFDGTNDIVVAGTKRYNNDAPSMPYPEGIDGFHLKTEEIKLLISQDHPLFHKEKIYAHDLDNATLLLPPDIYEGYIRDKVTDRLLEHGAKINLQTISFDNHFEYFTHNFSHQIGIVPTTLIPRFGINQREELRAFSLEDFALNTEFFALYTQEFAQSEHGAILINAMKSCLEIDKASNN